MMALICFSRAAEDPLPDWPGLVEIAKRHQMPFPPPTAPLALIHSQTWTVVGNKSHPHDPANYHPGWILEKQADGSLRVLMGMYEQLLKPREAREPLSREFTLKDTPVAIGGFVSQFDDVSTFLVAIQCAQRNDLTHADALWDRFSSGARISDGFEDVASDVGPAQPAQLLAALLFSRCELMITDPSVAFSAISTDMDALLKEFPLLANEERKNLLAQVKATATAKPAAKDSVESSLIAWGNSRDEGPTDENDPNRTMILGKGFSAIPDLLRWQNDKRLTRMRYSAIMMRPSSPKPLGDLAKQLLVELLPDAPDLATGFDSPASGNFTKAWETAQGKGERAYYLANAWKRNRNGQLQFSDAAMLIIGKSYPEEIKGLIKKFDATAKKSDSCWGLASAILGSTLTEDAKIDLLLGMAQKGSLSSRQVAIRALTKIQHHAAIAPACALVRTLPKDASGPYWTSDVASVSHLVMAVDDDEVWQTFFQATKKAAVGLRLEWMNPFDYSYVGDRLKQRRIAFLAGFLHDTTLRDDSVNAKKYDGPCAAFTFPKITVRNFAAMQIASILDIDRLNSPDATWTDAQWETLQSKVQKRLKQEGITPMK